VDDGRRLLSEPDAPPKPGPSIASGLARTPASADTGFPVNGQCAGSPRIPIPPYMSATRRYVLALAEDAERAIQAEGTLVIDQVPGVVLIEADVAIATKAGQRGAVRRRVLATFRCTPRVHAVSAFGVAPGHPGNSSADAGPCIATISTTGRTRCSVALSERRRVYAASGRRVAMKGSGKKKEVGGWTPNCGRTERTSWEPAG
jgi:hypothetical protein